MRPQAEDGCLQRAPRRAFSLAEMMIALAVLAMGLLVIGAALPVGLRFNEESMNRATGQAAAKYALNLIEQNVSLPEEIISLLPTVHQIREPVVFQPRRSPLGSQPGQVVPDYEPVIKVRPLFTQNISAKPGSTYGFEFDIFQSGFEVVGEAVIRNYLEGDPDGGTETREYDPAGNFWLRPALPSVAMVYPPITRDQPYLPEDFIAGMGGDPYEVRPVWSPNTNPIGAETLKALERRVLWTAFYRRVSYQPDSDPNWYEFIVVAVRRPSDRHRFPMQATTSGGMSGLSRVSSDSGKSGKSGKGTRSGSTWNSGSVLTYSGAGLMAPIPWLVTFDRTSLLPRPEYGFDDNGMPDNGIDPPATLRFTCTEGLSGLFPVGSVIIPARNDDSPDLVPDESSRVGFGPIAPTTLAIYEVVARPDPTTVEVKYNGYYPRQGTNGTPPPGQWPVWVVPPAFEETDSNGDAILPDRSPILAVSRRYIHLSETP